MINNKKRDYKSLWKLSKSYASCFEFHTTNLKQNDLKIQISKEATKIDTHYEIYHSNLKNHI